MSKYYDRVQNSTAVTELRDLQTRASDLAERKWVNQNVIDLIVRLEAVNKTVLNRLTLSDCNLITQSTLQDLGSQVQQLQNAVNELDSLPLDGEPNIAQLDEAADAVLRTSSVLPFAPDNVLGEELQNYAQQYRHEAESATGFMRGEFEKIQIQLGNVERELGEHSSQSKEILTQAQELVTEQTNQSTTNLNALQTRINQATSQLESEVAKIDRDFQNAQAERENQFKADQERRDREYHDSLDSTVAQVEEFKNQASSMLEEVAGASMAEHYAKQRDRQNHAADRWRLVGVGALCLLVAVASGLLVELRMNGGDLSIPDLLARSGVPASLLVLATYALRQSGHHRQREEDVARVSNELMLLWPFLNRLPDEDRKALMLGITPLYFKGGLSNHDAGDKVGWADQLVDKVSRRRSN